MVNTQERSNKSASVNEIEQLKASNANDSVGSSTTSSFPSLSTPLPRSSLSNDCPPQSPSSASSATAASLKSVSSATTSPSINFAKNATAQAATAGTQSHHKLIPIQSVLNTADHQQHHPHYSHHSSYHNPAYNHHSSSNNLQLQQSGGATHHLNVPTTTLQQFLSGATTHAQLPTELPHEDEERLANLFKQLDRDGNGRIDIHDLSEALREFGLSSVYAEKFLEHSDQTQSGDVGLAEFVHYVREHEKNLRLQFSHLDKNRDGKVDLEELISAFKDLGIEVDMEEARHLLSRMDQDGSLNISFNEWRDFLLLAPSSDIHDLIKFWRHSTEYKMKITNAQQFDALIAELEKNPCLAKGFRKGTVPSNFKQEWEKISISVNAHGPPMRDGDGWQKVWRDLKFKTKKKLVANKAECNATGGGRYKQCALSPLEESVANMLQFELTLNPEGAVQGVDCPTPYTEYEVLEPDFTLDEVVELVLPQEQEKPTTSNIKKRQKENVSVQKQKKPNQRQMLLEKHSTKQAKLLTEISNTLGSVKRSLRECNQCQKKMLDIEERKLQIMEATNKREEERHESQMKIDKIKVLIKEKELQLLN